MRVTGLGHASALIETKFGSVLTDPWVNPAYFGSWFPFPDNSGLDWDSIGQADYLFVSHLHRDHFDPEHLKRHISKKATVLLPAYATSELEDQLRDLGFSSFVKTVSDEVVDLDGLQIMIQSLISPTDGPIGDSSLWLTDGTTIVLNQNDARPSDLTSFQKLGHVDVHLLQFSGAIWFPMVYDLPKRAKQALGATKRERQFDRTLRYIQDLEASYVFPTAGPPCFLDDELWGFNDIFGDESNIFPDQKVFLDWLSERGRTNGRLLLPGTVAHVSEPHCPVQHPMPDAEVEALFADKTSYLLDMKARRQPEVEQAKLGWAHPEVDVLGEITKWFTPLLEEADHMAAGINGGVRFTAADAERGDVDFILDFVTREVRPYQDEKVRYRFQTKRAYLEQLIVEHEIDWVNSLFLSCRFTATRIGPYNEYVYTFFKCLSEERLNYAEGWFAEAAHDDKTIEMGGYAFQSRCPHLKADLTRFGKVDDGVLTCQMHGWKWNLDTGKCITSVGHPIRTEGAIGH
ncbi:Rieske 2Fe-2S domain-containing protein [Jatrophihabitans telluris]|uniref:Rieske 2Fe-2S domain-containing protein n=1 Tax=Jatrophihabitans telluris TaxID=2038343 RepID=A0ABY4R2H6_9ACTN|nr:Rieske 2Fe-2S domain-containing protein [Jatrophihabitans telluris]UQX89608.1 Rieske 2Fe-2S domain-containing protein [Jatrophihabitans telluris]